MTAQHPPNTPTHEVQQRLAAGGARTVAGVDEVGRGAWAGPVVVCAAVAPWTTPPEGLTDSKRLTPQRRRELAAELSPWLHSHAFGQAEATEIDAVGMTEALRRSANRALAALAENGAEGAAPPDTVILDGKHDFLGPPWSVHTQVGADLDCVCVAAASVLAKCHRDTQMATLAESYPGYGFASAVGYPSPAHRQALAEWGPTTQHRLSWSYLDGLARWRHLRRPRPAPPGQTMLC